MCFTRVCDVVKRERKVPHHAVVAAFLFSRMHTVAMKSFEGDEWMQHTYEAHRRDEYRLNGMNGPVHARSSMLLRDLKSRSLPLPDM